MNPTYWIHKTADGVFELRQVRFRERWVIWREEHPHDVCAINPSRSGMVGMVELLKAQDKTDWVFHLDPRSDDFLYVRRPMMDCWLHKSLPIWISEYQEFKNVEQPRHWQVYIGRGDLNDREPWSDDNVKLNHVLYGYRDPISALHAASEYAALLGRKAK
jgi:hypothetical protein